MEEKDKSNKTNKSENYQRNSNSNKKSGYSLWWIYALIFIPLITMYILNDSPATKEITWTEFQQFVSEDVFEEIIVLNKKNGIEAVVKRERFAEVFKHDIEKAKEQNTKVTALHAAITSVILFSAFFMSIILK